MKKTLLSILAMGVTGAFCQLTIGSGATFVIQNGASVTVQGDVVSQSNIQGAGKLIMKGTSAQNLNLNNNTIQTVLEIDNANGVNVAGNTILVNHLLFTNGKLNLTGAANFTLGDTSTFTGANASKYVVTNGTGSYQKRIANNATVTLPIGNDNYNPLTVAVAGGSAFSNAFVSGVARKEKHPNQHPRTTDFINTYWTVGRSGFTGGTMALTGTYQNADLSGSEVPMESLLWNGSAWTLGGANDEANNTLAANTSSTTNVDLHGMNKFILVSPKVFLQGAFNAGTGLMNDNLRTAPAVIPLTDPYRVAPYTSNYTHVNNTIAETISATVLNDQGMASNNIVDWVYVELRTITNATTAPVVQTRSGLVQRDGDVVDIDGVSPIYFKDVNAGNYTVALRHRNHIGMSSNPATPLALGLSNTSYDFTTAGAGGIFGTLGTNYTQAGAPLRNLMYAGNGNSNANIRYTGVANDKDYLFLTSLSGNVGAVQNNVYSAGDYNLNRIVRYTGIANDKDFLFLNILGGSVGTVRTQSLPAN